MGEKEMGKGVGVGGCGGGRSGLLNVTRGRTAGE